MKGREQRPVQGGGNDPPPAEVFDPEAFALRLAEARARRSRVLASQAQATRAATGTAVAAPVVAGVLRAPAAVALAPAGPLPPPPELPPPAPGRARAAGGRSGLVFLGGLALGVALAGLAVTLGRGPALSSVAPTVVLEPPAAAPAPTAGPGPAVPAAFGPPAGAAVPARFAAVAGPDRASPLADLRPQPRPDGFAAPVPQVTRVARDRRAAPAAAPDRAGPPNLPRLIGGLLRQLATNRKPAVPPGETDD